MTQTKHNIKNGSFVIKVEVLQSTPLHKKWRMRAHHLGTKESLVVDWNYGETHEGNADTALGAWCDKYGCLNSGYRWLDDAYEFLRGSDGDAYIYTAIPLRGKLNT